MSVQEMSTFFHHLREMAAKAEDEAVHILRLEQARYTELQNELTAAKRTIRQLQKLRNAQYMTPTRFTEDPQNTDVNMTVSIKLAVLRMKTGQREGFSLVYCAREKHIKFVNKDGFLYHDRLLVTLFPRHLMTLIHCTEASNIMVLGGRKDAFSDGQIWLEFASTQGRSAFLDLVTDMNSHIRIGELERETFAHMCSYVDILFPSTPGTVIKTVMRPKQQAAVKIKDHTSPETTDVNTLKRNLRALNVEHPDTDEGNGGAKKARKDAETKGWIRQMSS